MVKKTKLFERNDKNDKTPLTACDFNSSGNLLAFSSGYDLSKGAEAVKEFNSGVKICIHYLPPNQRKKWFWKSKKSIINILEINKISKSFFLWYILIK